MQLNNFYERALWNEWNQLKRGFQKRSIRQFYYPQYMDTYYQFESKLSVMQRQQISNAKNHYHQLGNLRLTQDQEKIWNEQTKIIKEDDVQKALKTLHDAKIQSTWNSGEDTFYQ